MRPITTDLSFFKRFKPVGKPSHGNAGPAGMLAADDEKSQPVEPKTGEKVEEQQVLEMIVENPQMNASTFYNTLKSRGMKIVREAKRVAESRSTWESFGGSRFKRIAIKKKPKEADSASANTQVLRPQKESFNIPIRSARFLEGAAKDNGVGHTRFRVILLQEGLGNLKDAYYYSREALQSAVPVFEGKKIYADHPTAIEERTRPERSVKDVLGHFESVALQEGDDGQAQLVADVVILPEEPYRWARALMSHSVEYAKRYPDKDFVGLSINASGDAESMSISALMEKGVPDSAVQKLRSAQAEGIEQVKLVSVIKDAVSCDLVTEAGAGGKVLEMLEKEKTMAKKPVKKMTESEMKQEEKKEAEEKHEAEEKKEAAPDAKADGEKHDDEQQDVALIKKMIAEYLGDDEAESEEVMKMCKEAYEAYTEMGYEADEALKAAGHAMKLAKHMASKETKESDDEKPAAAADKKSAPDAEKKEAAPEKSEEKKETDEKKEESHKESDVVIKMSAELSALKEKLQGFELREHMEKTLRESGLSRKATTDFKESLKESGGVKSANDFDSKFKFFVETRKRLLGSETLDFVISNEKREEAKPISSFADCVR